MDSSENKEILQPDFWNKLKNDVEGLCVREQGRNRVLEDVKNRIDGIQQILEVLVKKVQEHDDKIHTFIDNYFEQIPEDELKHECKCGGHCHCHEQHKQEKIKSEPEVNINIKEFKE